MMLKEPKNKILKHLILEYYEIICDLLKDDNNDFKLEIMHDIIFDLASEIERECNEQSEFKKQKIPSITEEETLKLLKLLDNNEIKKH